MTNSAASELGKLSVIKRRKLAGGQEGFRRRMQEIAKLPRKKVPKTPLDKGSTKVII
jgi:hypothetical protein